MATSKTFCALKATSRVVSFTTNALNVPTACLDTTFLDRISATKFANMGEDETKATLAGIKQEASTIQGKAFSLWAKDKAFLRRPNVGKFSTRLFQELVNGAQLAAITDLHGRLVDECNNKTPINTVGHHNLLRARGIFKNAMEEMCQNAESRLADEYTQLVLSKDFKIKDPKDDAGDFLDEKEEEKTRADNAFIEQFVSNLQTKVFRPMIKRNKKHCEGLRQAIADLKKLEAISQRVSDKIKLAKQKEAKRPEAILRILESTLDNNYLEQKTRVMAEFKAKHAAVEQELSVVPELDEVEEENLTIREIARKTRATLEELDTDIAPEDEDADIAH